MDMSSVAHLNLFVAVDTNERGVYLREHFADGEEDGWQFTIDKAGSLLILEATKDGEPTIRQSLSLKSILSQWVEFALTKKEGTV